MTARTPVFTSLYSSQRALYASSTDLWYTPQDFFDKLNEEFHFTLDACAIPENAKCERFYSPEDDGLSDSCPWTGTVWLNPPYGKGIGAWMAKALESSRQGATVVALVPPRTDTKWFHENCLHPNVEIRFVKGRLKFGGSTISAPFPSLVIVFRPEN